MGSGVAVTVRDGRRLSAGGSFPRRLEGEMGLLDEHVPTLDEAITHYQRGLSALDKANDNRSGQAKTPSVGFPVQQLKLLEATMYFAAATAAAAITDRIDK